uniref:Coiled-coil domain containing 146 n=1 Tax=Sphenodon punctatus TaxID=8508 RepID=A0A8D0GWM7_SPHPU
LLKHTNNLAVKDSIQSDVYKVMGVLQEMKEKREQQLMDVDRLTNMLTRVEEEMVQLRKKYERAVQRRNESCPELLQQDEQDIKFLSVMKIYVISLFLVWQYSQCKDRIRSLEKIFSDPEKENRMRLLRGKDPTLPELFKKIEELEIQLTQQEEKLLIRSKAENGKQDTLILAKRMNELQRKIKNTTQKMMALIAELSMKQAIAIKLQQEARDKEQFLMTVSSRIEKGLPPPEEIKEEWLKVLHDELHRAAAEAKLEFLETFTTCIYTTAEQRPNAYIPDDENVLPLPRPYGALAPFKPSEPGSNMRHIRKPIVKPIEI